MEMKNSYSYFVQWINAEGIKQIPLLIRAASFETAAEKAVTTRKPVWATDNTPFIIWRGNPGRAETPRAEFTVSNVNQIGETT